MGKYSKIPKFEYLYYFKIPNSYQYSLLQERNKVSFASFLSRLLPDMNSASSRISMLVDEDTPTQIKCLMRQNPSGDWFDLQGRKVVDAKRKGVYIKGRKKVVVK